MTIGENVLHFNKIIGGKGGELVAITKTKSVEEILEAYRFGQKDFGENKVQEMVDKYNQLPKDITWHMVGHLQTNKVKNIASFVGLIHSVDSLKLLMEINKQGEKTGRVISCLLQICIAEEETKFGFDVEEVKMILGLPELRDMNSVKIKGLMGMATYTDDTQKIRMEFRRLKNLYDQIRSNATGSNISFDHLSMGMSGDYDIALEEGSNMVRIGTAIFGERNYNA
jgi:hypothetical protein